MAEHKGNDGFFQKPLFKSWNGNKMAIRTDKAYYVSGELVTGTITVKCAADLACRGVMFKVTGYEKVEWQQVRTEYVEFPPEEEGGAPIRRPDDYVEEFDSKKEFFKERVKVSDEMEMLQEGIHEFPFQYQLPPGLPGVFEYKKKRTVRLRKPEAEDEEEKLKTVGKIVYKLKCYLDFQWAKDLKAKQELVVHELLGDGVQPAHAETVQNVMFCCCINRGECELVADFDKNAYAPGETAQCLARIDNRSASDVGAMVVKLMRTITLKDKHGRTNRIVDTVLQAEYEGVPAETQAERPMPLQFAPEMQPSTGGKLCHCQYHFDVECDISMAPDIELHMPVILYAPPPMMWGVPIDQE